MGIFDKILGKDSKVDKSTPSKDGKVSDTNISPPPPQQQTKEITKVQWFKQKYDTYRIGIVGMRANPLHTGHIQLIIQALSQVDKLFVVLTYSDKWDRLQYPNKEEYISAKKRVNALKRFIDHLNRNKYDAREKIVLIATDLTAVRNNVLDETGAIIDGKLDEYWEEDLKLEIGQALPIIRNVFNVRDEDIEKSLIYFTSESAYEPFILRNRYFKKVTIVDEDRRTVNISATKIRQMGVYKMHKYLAEGLKQSVYKMFYFVGVESTGKSTASYLLSNTTGLHYVDEAGREVCAKRHILGLDGYREIITIQKYLWLDMLKYLCPGYISDTDLVVTLNFLINDAEAKAEDENAYNELVKNLKYEIKQQVKGTVFLFSPLANSFVNDGNRFMFDDDVRMMYHESLKKLYKEMNIDFIELSTDRAEALLQVTEQIKHELGEDVIVTI